MNYCFNPEPDAAATIRLQVGPKKYQQLIVKETRFLVNLACERSTKTPYVNILRLVLINNFNRLIT